jgi:toxin ParE1/3/4
MSFDVEFSRNARRDLLAIARYVKEAEGPASAEHVFRKIQDIVNSLTELPLRGTHPRELLALGNREFRQVYFKPYRVIYKVVGDRVVIVLIADGRRDMKALLSQRLLGSA